MQTMLIDSKLIEDIKESRKTITIRRGERDVVCGPLKFVGTEGEEVDVYVVAVTHKPLYDITEEDVRMEGARNMKELYMALLYYYPDCMFDDIFTFVEFIYRGESDVSSTN